MERTAADPGRKLPAQVWGFLAIAVGIVLGWTLDDLVPGKILPSYSSLGFMLGVTLSTYLQEKANRWPRRWSLISGLVFLWFLVLRFVFKA